MADHFSSLMPTTLTRTEGQIPLLIHHGFSIQQDLFPISCTDEHGALGRCFAPLCSIIPVAIAVCVLIAQILKPLLRLRPAWMKSFIEEHTEKREDQASHKTYNDRSIIALWVLILSGLTLEVVTVLYPSPKVTAILMVVPWVMSNL